MIGARKYEARLGTLNARLHRRAGSFRAVRFPGGCRAVRSAIHAEAAGNDLSKEESGQSPQARAEAEAYAFRRFPRPCRLERKVHCFRFRLAGLADQVLVHEPLAYDLRNRQIEPIPVVHVLPVVVAERLFVNVPEQMEGFDGDISAFEAPLQEAPEVLQPVGVNLPVNVGFGVIDDLVREVLTQTPVGKQFIGVDVRSLADVLLNDGLKSLFLPVVNHGRSDLAAALEHAYHDGLLKRIVLALRGVHVSRLAADEGFIYFDMTGQLAALFSLVCLPNPVKHEPRGFLADSKSAVKLPGGDTVLGIGEEPHRRKPFIQSERGVFKDSANLNGELPLRVVTRALPAELILQETDTLATAGRASDLTVRPPLRRQIVQAVLWVSKVQDRILKSDQRFRFHGLIVPQNRGLVKFIIALPNGRAASSGSASAFLSRT